MKFYGVCPASCGEFVQGILDNEEYLSSYAINLFSVATLEESKDIINKGPSKSRRAMELVFEKFNIPIEDTKNISLNIKSQIPIGKGMASSTADIGATIKATLSMLNKTLTGEEISKLAVKIEATDSLLLNQHSIFNPLTADVKKYLVYFQNFTNTHEKLEVIRERYEQAINEPGVVGINIGTRPDCLPDETIEYLAELSERMHVTVELGLQTTYEETSELINRAHSYELYVETVRRLRKYPKIEIVAKMTM